MKADARIDFTKLRLIFENYLLILAGFLLGPTHLIGPNDHAWEGPTAGT